MQMCECFYDLQPSGSSDLPETKICVLELKQIVRFMVDMGRGGPTVLSVIASGLQFFS